MSKSVIVVALALASLTACKRNPQDAGFWERERQMIQMTKSLELLRYRYNRVDFDGMRELEDHQNRLREFGPRLSELVSKRAGLTAEISQLEGRIAEFAQLRTEEIRAGVQGRKFATLSLNNGRVFKDVLITAVEESGVEIRHQSGAAKLRYRDLSIEQRELFGLEEDAALAAENREKLQAAAYESRIAEELAVIREKRRLESAAPSRATALRQSSFVAAATKTPRPCALSQPAKPVGNSGLYSSPYRSYRSYRPTYRHVYYYNTNRTPYCSSGTSRSTGFPQRVDRRICNP